MPDLWKEMMLGTVAGEEAKGISICCELLGGKGTDRIFVSQPSWRGGKAVQSVRAPSESGLTAFQCFPCSLGSCGGQQILTSFLKLHQASQVCRGNWVSGLC